MLKNKPIRYLGFGSPLMDAIGEVTEEILKKYNPFKIDTTSN